MKCAYCEIELTEQKRVYPVFELEWDQEGYPYFFEQQISLCDIHQKNLEDFTKKQKWMNAVQLTAFVVLIPSSIAFLFVKNYFAFGAALLFIIGLVWFRMKPGQRILRTEEDCIAYGYQFVMASKKDDDVELVQYFSRYEKEKIFHI